MVHHQPECTQCGSGVYGEGSSSTSAFNRPICCNFQVVFYVCPLGRIMCGLAFSHGPACTVIRQRGPRCLPSSLHSLILDSQVVHRDGKEQCFHHDLSVLHFFQGVIIPPVTSARLVQCCSVVTNPLPSLVSTVPSGCLVNFLKDPAILRSQDYQQGVKELSPHGPVCSCWFSLLGPFQPDFHLGQFLDHFFNNLFIFPISGL